MRKEQYEKFINPAEFAKLYDEWAAKGKPQGNDPLYIQIWNGATNAVKACIGALQASYHCKYQDYDDKVIDGTIMVVTKLLKMNETPKNIVNVSYLYVLGVCCGPKARQSEFEDNMLSLDNETEGGDTFSEMMYLDEDGHIQYSNY